MNTAQTKFDMTHQVGLGYATNTGNVFMFDKEDYGLIKDYAWWENEQGYIVTSIDGKNIRMHRLVFPAGNGYVVDHKNRNRFDNRKCNLRIATKQQNNINRAAARSNRLGVKGVSFNKRQNRYEARICVGGRRIYLGSHATLDGAREIREKAEEDLFGEFAYREGCLFDG